MNIVSMVSPSKYSEKELLDFLLSHAGEQRQPVALWRLPASGLTQLIISEKYLPIDREQFVEELDPGFLVAPFDKSKNRFYLRADHFFTFENGSMRTQG